MVEGRPPCRPRTTLTVKFVAKENSRTAGIYDLRLIRP